MSTKMERFTSRARRVLALAQQEAESVRATTINAEYVLVALALEKGGVAERVFASFGLDADQLRTYKAAKIAASPQTALTLAEDAKQMLVYTVDEARQMGHAYIGTEHLLLGLLRLNHLGILQILSSHQLDTANVRERTRSILQQAPASDDDAAPGKQEVFTSRARRVLALAQQEAETVKAPVIAVEHLLIALALENGGVAGKVLDELGATADALRAAQPPIVTATAPTQQLQLADEVKRALEYAVDEARKLGHHYIGTEHLVLGILRLNHAGVNTMLAACELDANDLRLATLRTLQSHPLNTKPKRKLKSDPDAPLDLEEAFEEIIERIGDFFQSLFSGKPKR